MTKIDYSQLFYHKEVRVESKKNDRISPFPLSLSVEIRDLHNEIDCKVGHFGHNFWLRTPYGVKKKRYKNEKTLELSVEKMLKNKGLKILNWIKR